MLLASCTFAMHDGHCMRRQKLVTAASVKIHTYTSKHPGRTTRAGCRSSSVALFNAEARPMQAVIYCRVSTKEQVENLSLATQRRACEEYCRRAGWGVARAFVDAGESAKTADRPEFQSMLAYCRENRKRVGVVVVY